MQYIDCTGVINLPMCLCRCACADVPVFGKVEAECSRQQRSFIAWVSLGPTGFCPVVLSWWHPHNGSAVSVDGASYSPHFINASIAFHFLCSILLFGKLLSVFF